MAPDDLVQYLGAHEQYRPECDLAYHNQLMVMLWSSIATRDARLATVALRRLRPAPPESGWVTYVRCHDDIGWAVSDDGRLGRRLEPVRAPAVPRGVLRRPDRRAASPGARRSRTTRRPGTPARPGSTAALCGLELAVLEGDDGRGHRRRTPPAPALLGRLLLRRHPAGLHGRRARAVRRRGLGQPALPGGRQPLDAPALTWTGALAERRHDPATVEGRVFAGLRRSAPSGVRSRRSGSAARPSCWTPRTRTCWPTCAPIPAGTPSGRGQRRRRGGLGRGGVGGRRAVGGGRGPAGRSRAADRGRRWSTAPPTPTWTSTACAWTAPASPGSPPLTRPLTRR